MKQKHIFLLILCIACSAASFAQKSIYIPEQMKSEGYSESDESKQWCKKRSRESNNIIVFFIHLIYYKIRFFNIINFII